MQPVNVTCSSSMTGGSREASFSAASPAASGEGGNHTSQMALSQSMWESISSCNRARHNSNLFRLHGSCAERSMTRCCSRLSWGVLGHFKCIDRATTEMDIPNARKRELYSKLHLHSIHTLQNLVFQRRYLERQKPTSEARGRIRGRWPLFPLHPLHRGRTVNRLTPSRLTAFIFIIILC